MTTDKQRNADFLYYAFLLILAGAYTFYLLSFTFYEGFSTLSNDAANYVLMARKWSPFFEPTAAELFTWPLHPYPPALSWLLAFTGASESLWASHLVVSLCMAVSIVLIAHYVRGQTTALTAGLLAVVMCLPPGIIIHSLGILSENLYLLFSAGALLVYSGLSARPDASWRWYLGLFLLLAAAMLSRTAGIALAGAFVVVPILDQKLASLQRVMLPLTALASMIVWPLWDAMRPGEFELGYGEYLYFFLAGKSFVAAVEVFWQIFTGNVVKLLGSWVQYFALNSTAALSFPIAYLLFMACAPATVLRAARLKPDAVYILFYLGVILFYPLSEQMTRFLHPVALLLLVQPVLCLSERGHLTQRGWAVCAAGAAILAIHSAVIQIGMLSSRAGADENLPQLRHSPEYYLATAENYSMLMARRYAGVTELMAATSEKVPSDGVVASDKHDIYALLSDRKAVALSDRVSLSQQLCNFQLKGVHFVFLAGFASTLNLLGPARLYTDFVPLARRIWSMSSDDGTPLAYLMEIDPSLLAAALDESGFVCERYRISN